MSYEAKQKSVLRVLSEGRAVIAHIYLDKRLDPEVALCRCYAMYTMLEYDIREVAYRFGPHRREGPYLVAELYPMAERHPKKHSLFLFPEDY